MSILTACTISVPVGSLLVLIGFRRRRPACLYGCGTLSCLDNAYNLRSLDFSMYQCTSTLIHGVGGADCGEDLRNLGVWVL